MSSYDLLLGGDTELVGDAVDELLRGVGDDLSGVDDEMGAYGEQLESLGAARRARRAAGGVKVAAKVNKLAIGIGATNIAANSSAVITVTPQLPFRLERFITPSVGLQVTDIKVGTNSQFVGSGSIPIEVFATNSVGVSLRGDTAVPGVDISLGLANPSAGILAATGAYIGYAAA